MKYLAKKVINFLSASINTIILNRKIALIYKSISSVKQISRNKILEYKRIWIKFGSDPNVKWFKVYASINGIDNPSYIPETNYYNKVEPVLNNRTFSEAYCDKNSYHRYIDNDLLPRIYLRNIQGVYYSSDYEMIKDYKAIDEFIPEESDKIIAKIAIDSGGGREVELFSRKDGHFESPNGIILTKSYLEQRFKKNFIVQEYIHQHEYYHKLNASSVNTIRILTYRSVITNEIIPLQSVLRIGKEGAIIDNQASGGIACGINKFGVLNKFAVNKSGKKFYEINGLPISNIPPVYKYDEAVGIAIRIARMNFYHRLIGFDFCVDNTNTVKLIELNNRNNEINFYQMNNGPLFREYTDEVIDYCIKNRKTICFDFEI
ncbi:MAG: hypothetical protein LLG13_18670 [Bacteroidales bacterium]|nr:hypothetical protein [Bacteroidales bacterium]